MGKEGKRMEHIMSGRENGTLWQDVQGDPVHAHGGWMLKYQGTYYWYGEDRRGRNYVSCYRSDNLLDWTFCNHVLTADSPCGAYRVRTDLRLTREDGQKVNIERPKVLYHAPSGKFVLWAHYENGADYRDAACCVATCDRPDGNFVYHGHFQPFGFMSRDCTVFQEEDGTAYFISASRDNADLHVYRLSDDYMNTEALVHRLFQGEYREAPAVIKINGLYYMITSGCTGWAPNQAKYAVAESMEGRWSQLMDIGDSTCYGSQAAFLFMKDGHPLYFGDRWGGNGEKYFSSGYTVYPLETDEGRLYMHDQDTFEGT